MLYTKRRVSTAFASLDPHQSLGGRESWRNWSSKKRHRSEAKWAHEMGKELRTKRFNGWYNVFTCENTFYGQFLDIKLWLSNPISASGRGAAAKPAKASRVRLEERWTLHFEMEKKQTGCNYAKMHKVLYEHLLSWSWVCARSKDASDAVSIRITNKKASMLCAWLSNWDPWSFWRFRPCHHDRASGRNVGKLT